MDHEKLEKALMSKIFQSPPEAGLRLSSDHIYEVILIKLPGATPMDVGLYFSGAYSRAIDTMHNSSSIRENEPLKHQLNTLVLPQIFEYFLTIMQTPELIGSSWPDCWQNSMRIGMWTEDAKYPLVDLPFLVKVADLLHTRLGLPEVVNVFLPIFERQIIIPLKHRTDSDHKWEMGALLHTLLASPKTALVEVLAESALTFPPDFRLSPRDLMDQTLVGFLMKPNPIDSYYTDPTQKVPHSCTRDRYLTNCHQRSITSVNSVLRIIQNEHKAVTAQIWGVVQPLLKGSAATRKKLISFLMELVENSDSRSRMDKELPSAHQWVNLMETSESDTPMEDFMRRRTGMLHRQEFTSGQAFNLLQILLDLCRPIKRDFSEVAPIQETGDLQEDLQAYAKFPFNPGHYVSMETRRMHLRETNPGRRKKPFERVPKVGGDHESLAPLYELIAGDPLEAPFKTQIFTITERAIDLLLVPLLKEGDSLFRVFSLVHHRRIRKLGNESGKFWFAYQAALLAPSFLEPLGHFVNLFIQQILSLAYNSPGANFDECVVPPQKVSLGFKVQPCSFAESILEVLSQFRTYEMFSESKFINTYFDQPLLVNFLIFILGSGDHIRNPSTRGKAAVLLHYLAGSSTSFSEYVNTSPYSVRNLIPSCIRVFTAVEKTHQSYFDVRMQIKFELRIPILELIARLIALDGHRAQIGNFALNEKEMYLKFVNQLLNDATYLLDEGLDNLIAYRERNEGAAVPVDSEEEESSEEPAEGDNGFSNEVDQEVDMQGGTDIYRQSRHDPKIQAKTYLKMGNRTIKTLWRMCQEIPEVIVEDEVIVTQLIKSFLNPCLDRLVGPKCLKLKSKSKINDFEVFNFHPKELLTYICEIYLLIYRVQPRKMVKICSEDGRHFNPKTFNKAVAILVREAIMGAAMITEFHAFVKTVNESSDNLSQQADLVIPDEFCDPIMAEIMVDPVRLPTGFVMDRKHIQRVIMSSDECPFTRLPLKMEDLLPDEELRTRIHQWAQENQYSLGFLCSVSPKVGGRMDLVDHQVKIELKDGRTFTGTLNCLDSARNVILEKGVETTPAYTLDSVDFLPTSRGLGLVFVPGTAIAQVYRRKV